MPEVAEGSVPTVTAEVAGDGTSPGALPTERLRALTVSMPMAERSVAQGASTGMGADQANPDKPAPQGPSLATSPDLEIADLDQGTVAKSALSQADILEDGGLPQPESGTRPWDEQAETGEAEHLSATTVPDPADPTAALASAGSVIDPVSSAEDVAGDAAFWAPAGEQPASDGTTSRVLTEVSVAPATVSPAAQMTQSGPAAAQTHSLAQPTPALDLSQASWPDKLVEDVSLHPMGRGDTLTLTLTPERLGTLQVRLEMQDGQTHVHFVAETPEAARLLTDAQPRLADLMSRAGVDLGNQSATTGEGSQQNDRSGQPTTLQDMSAEPNPEAGPETGAPQGRSAYLSSRSTVDVVA
jgi:flagellar hook-length control protein FliK